MISKKTLLVLTSSFPTQSDLYKTHFIAILSRYLSNDFRIVILCPHKKGLPKKEVTESFIIYRFRYAPSRFEQLAYGGGIVPNIKANPLLLTLVPFFLISQFFSTLSILSIEKVDLLHAHWLIPQGLIAVLVKIFNKKIKILVTSHGADLFSLKGIAAKKIKQFILNHADGVTVVSQSMSNYIRGNLSSTPRILEVVPMGTDLQKLFIPPKTNERNDNTILFVGRLVEKKGVKYLIEAFSFLARKKPRLKLLIIGDGPEKNNLKRLSHQLNLNENVSFIDPVSHRELVHFYHKATIACFPFIIAECGDQEGLGLVVVEAMGCMCPVLVGRVPAIQDTVKDELTGLIINPKEIKNFSSCLERLLYSKELQEKLSTQARQHVQTNFGWEKISSRYKNILQNL